MTNEARYQEIAEQLAKLERKATGLKNKRKRASTLTEKLSFSAQSRENSKEIQSLRREQKELFLVVEYV